MNDKDTPPETDANPSPNAEDEAKIVVDEDWKSQVQAEKEAAEQQRQQEQEPQPGRGRIPPASLELLVTSMAAQCMMGLGLMPDPFTNEVSTNLDLAKHQIDTLDMLEQKTEGNRTKEETDLLSNSLHELRMLYVSVSKAPPAPTSDEPPESGNIVMP